MPDFARGGRRRINDAHFWVFTWVLDFQNRRADFVKAVIDNLANWDFAAEQLAA